MLLLILISTACFTAIQGNIMGKVSKFESDLLKVYLFPHSHDDVGWVKTLRQYYEEKRGVKQIISSYMEQLLKDPTKKFSQVEIAFFSIWWNEQSEEMKQKVKNLVKNEQLEFLSGGWCMNDEATAYYEDIVDQMTLGHKFLLSNFNYTPSVGWQVDPFGHSNTQALFSSKMGFNAWFFGRIDQQDRTGREQNQELEFVIHNQDQSILTHVNYYGYYSSPPGFDFDVNNQNRPPTVTANNVHRKADDLASYFTKQQKVYRGKVIAHTLGMDFQWSEAQSYFGQMDMVMNVINKNTSHYKMTIQYGTPKQYIESLYLQNITYPHQTEDFFPYQDYPNQYWSGYFTSRSSFKGYVRRIGRYFQITKKMFSLIKINNLCQKDVCDYDSIQSLAEALGTAQHHDAITGTAKQYVNDDYVKMIENGHHKMEDQMYKFLNKLSDNDAKQIQCHYNGTETCNQLIDYLKDSKTVIVTLINMRINNEGMVDYIKLYVPQDTLISVLDEENNQLEGEILCHEQLCTLHLKLILQKMIHTLKVQVVKEAKETKIIQIESTPYSVDTDTELFDKFRLHYNFYYSSTSGVSSGAYVFRPEGYSQEYGDYVKGLKWEGHLVKQIYIQKQFTKSWITTYEENVYHVETFVDSIQLTENRGKEVVIQVHTKIDNKGEFYTDSNGLYLQKRKINHRESWKMTVLEGVSANYFPVNGIIMIKDGEQACAVLNDRAQGGTSLSNGVIELMLQRRLTRDDNKGVFERLDEQEEIDHKRVGMRQMMSHTIVFYNHEKDPNRPRELQYQQDLKPLIYYTAKESIQYSKLENKFADFIFKEQDYNLGKFYIEPWLEENQYLVRVHNFRENGVLKLNFPSGVQFVEKTLTGNQDLVAWETNKFKWTDTFPKQDKEETIEPDEISPLSIRTWIVTI